MKKMKIEKVVIKKKKDVDNKVFFAVIAILKKSIYPTLITTTRMSPADIVAAINCQKLGYNIVPSRMIGEYVIEFENGFKLCLFPENGRWVIADEFIKSGECFAYDKTLEKALKRIPTIIDLFRKMNGKKIVFPKK